MYYQPELLLLISRERQRDMLADAERGRLLRLARRRERVRSRAAGQTRRRRPDEAGLSVPASTLTSCQARAEAPAR
jgi:hypothetical protein